MAGRERRWNDFQAKSHRKKHIALVGVLCVCVCVVSYCFHFKVGGRRVWGKLRWVCKIEEKNKETKNVPSLSSLLKHNPNYLLPSLLSLSLSFLFLSLSVSAGKTKTHPLGTRSNGRPISVRTRQQNKWWSHQIDRHRHCRTDLFSGKQCPLLKPLSHPQHTHTLNGRRRLVNTPNEPEMCVCVCECVKQSVLAFLFYADPSAWKKHLNPKPRIWAMCYAFWRRI